MPVFAPGAWAGVNDSFAIARDKERQDILNAQRRQEMERSQFEMQQALRDRQQQSTDFRNMGRLTRNLGAPPPVGGAAPQGPGPQPPMPGTPSQRMMAPGVPQFSAPPQGPAPMGGPAAPGMRGAPTQPDPRMLEIQRCQRDIQALQRELQFPGQNQEQLSIKRAELAKAQDQLSKLTGQPAPYRTVPQAGAAAGGEQGAPGGPPPAGPMAPPPVGGAQGGRQPSFYERFAAASKDLSDEELGRALNQMGPMLRAQMAEEATMARERASDAREERLNKALVEAARHHGATEAQGDRHLDQGAERIALAKQKQAAGQAPTSSELNDPEVANYWYEQYKLGGDKPPFAWGKAGEEDRKAWMRLLASKGRAGDVVAGRAEGKATGSALSANEKRNAGLDVGARETLADMQTLNSTIDSVAAKGGARVLNAPINKLRSLGSDPAYGQLELVTKQVATKYERMLSGGILSISQMHEGAREDSKRIMSGDMTVAEIRAKLPLMIREMENAQKAGKGTSGALRDRLAGKGDAGGDDQDAQAIAWAKSHPDDPRAKKILALHPGS